LGYKLPGAGRRIFVYVAKDPDAAVKIKQVLLTRRKENARFVEMNLSQTGLQISRS
jgi:hypothetical protein